MYAVQVENFEQWRDAARGLLLQKIPPQDVHWDGIDNNLGLFEAATVAANSPTSSSAVGKTSLGQASLTPPVAAEAVFTVSKEFIELARLVACHRDSVRWELLYRTLWRIKTGQSHLLRITTDDDVYRLTQMAKAVTRDVHKMKAFVRFRKVEPKGIQPRAELGVDGVESLIEAAQTKDETYVAWHRPDHHIVRMAAPFFARRFAGMNWSILTPNESVHWNQRELIFSPGVSIDAAPEFDVLEDLWRTYYASIFNPARVKVATMKREMPVRHWPTLPETSLIPELLQQADRRVQTMIETKSGFDKTATHYMPARGTPESQDLRALARAAQGCQACDLHRDATQTVFGEGPKNAKIVLVGEQPGDREDVEGHPFVGPAGELLNEALQAAGIAREDVYITNVVKHFKFTMRGKRRLHQKPNSRETFACRPWLESELAVIQPNSLVCLGATPAQALLGRDFRITQRRGEVIATDFCTRTIATWHPAALLRMPDPARKAEMLEQLISDLRRAI